MSHTSLTPAQYAQQTKTAAAELHTNPEATINDLFRVADALGVSAAELMRLGTTKRVADARPKDDAR